VQLHCSFLQERGDDVEIKLLADCVEVIPAVACLQQMEMYSMRTNRNFKQAIEKFEHRSVHRNKLPISLVAFEDTLPVGSVSLIEHELESHKHLSPWVATLFVSSQYRNQGIGKSLMEEVEKIALEMGYDTLYLFTDKASEYYLKMNWISIENVTPKGKPASVLMQKEMALLFS
jgi:predicted N-acetyltransferase YhbS